MDTSTASTAIEPSAPKFRECSRNDLKLAKNISNTFQNFNEYSKQRVSAVTDPDNSKIAKRLIVDDGKDIKHLLLKNHIFIGVRELYKLKRWSFIRERKK